MKARADERRRAVEDAAGSDWVERLMLIPGYDPFALSEGCWFDVDEAELRLDFFSQCLTHVEGYLAGEPFELQPWQQSVIANLFGWKRLDAIGRTVRRFRKMFFYVPRKNGKTPFVAGICLSVLVMDHERGAQMYGFGADSEQAALLYRQASGMVRNDPELESRLNVFKAVNQRSIVNPACDASYKVRPSKDGQHGRNPHFVAIDELHEIKNRELIEAVDTSFISMNRAQPLLVWLTTADRDRADSVCNEKLDIAKRVRDNPGDEAQPGYDPTFLPVVYEADAKEDDWRDEAVWKRVNPNLGVSVSVEALREMCRQAEENPVEENSFKRLHLNMKITSDAQWMRWQVWDKCDGAVIEDDLEGRKCYGGLDLSSVGDTTSFMLVFPPIDSDPLWRFLPRIWVPRGTCVKGEQKHAIPYTVWQKDGWITVCDGERVEHAEIQSQIEADCERFGVQQIAADRWNLEYMRQQLDPEGTKIVEFGQGFRSFSEPMKELLLLARSEKIAHGGHPVLKWQMGNVVAVDDDAGNIKPSKKKSKSKIDAPVALIMALGLALIGQEAEEPSVYNTRGLVTL